MPILWWHFGHRIPSAARKAPPKAATLAPSPTNPAVVTAARGSLFAITRLDTRPVSSPAMPIAESHPTRRLMFSRIVSAMPAETTPAVCDERGIDQRASVTGAGLSASAVAPNAVASADPAKTPSYAVVSTQDRMINPDLERFMSSRAKSETIELTGSHAIFLSHPKEIAALIEKAAQAAD